MYNRSGNCYNFKQFVDDDQIPLNVTYLKYKLCADFFSNRGTSFYYPQKGTLVHCLWKQTLGGIAGQWWWAGAGARQPSCSDRPTAAQPEDLGPIFSSKPPHPRCRGSRRSPSYVHAAACNVFGATPTRGGPICLSWGYQRKEWERISEMSLEGCGQGFSKMSLERGEGVSEMNEKGVGGSQRDEWEEGVGEISGGRGAARNWRKISKSHSEDSILLLPSTVFDLDVRSRGPDTHHLPACQCCEQYPAQCLTSEYEVATDSEGVSKGELEEYLSTRAATPVGTPAQTPTKLPEVTLVPETPDLHSDHSHSSTRQATNKLECPWRTNFRGVAFQTMPRRYIITFKPKFLPQLKVIDFHLKAIHELNENDPLNDLPSHLQIRKGKEGLLYMNINISSRLIRQKLVETYLGLLNGNVQSLHIQMMNDQNQLLQYLLLPLNKIPPEANAPVEGNNGRILGERASSSRAPDNESPRPMQQRGFRQDNLHLRPPVLRRGVPTPPIQSNHNQKSPNIHSRLPRGPPPLHRQTGPTTSPVPSIESYTFFSQSHPRITEAYCTLQPVRYAARFAAYLLRVGLSRLISFGISWAGLKKYMGNTGETADQQRNNIVSTIQDTVEKYDTRTYEQFLCKVPTSEQRQLLQLCGTSTTSNIKILIKIYNTESTSSIRSKHYYDIMMEHWDEDDIDTTAQEWFNDFFAQNNIDPVTFYTNFIRIQRSMMKINGFIIQGPTNAHTPNKDNTGFHFDELPSSTCALYEELLINLNNIGTWKLLLEGTPITTDIKHMDKEIIERLPFFLTMNTPIWVDASEIPPLKCRIFVYQFNTQIEHQTLSGLSMRKPPTILHLNIYIYIYSTT
ncbi:hypothetical protein PR048_033506 [Dryococelus australis]|uniref:Parvovirus non-structural protein 1 helicase domain-containing protein n=1 Tax=Dryococelus australis TaxID=614101 RepID=A0ABQ9G1Q1_9NEOP|nr:hypothetical protein PR048_033506 [Dryococelus australis]